MQITEEHILKYVFFNDSLDEEIKKYIDVHLEDFAEQIALCREINAPLSDEDDKELNGRIGILFPEQDRIFELFPKQDRILPKQDILTLAAASEIQERIETLSFTDKENQVIVRIIKEDGQSRLYLFPLNETEASYKIILYPSEETLTISDLKTSHKINSDIISRILIQVLG